MSKAASEAIAKELKRAGINAKAYARSPAGGAGFFASIYRRTVYLWGNEGTNLRIVPDKRFKQAVVTVKEPQREITTCFTDEQWKRWSVRDPRRSSYKKFKDEILNGYNSDSFPLNIPVEGVTHSYEITPDGDAKLRKAWESNRTATAGFEFNVLFSVKATAHVPASTIHLLMGMDETELFICALPKRPRDVQHAHDILRPSCVPKGSLRQGEWFFLPVEGKELEEYIQLPGPGWGHSLDVRSNKRLEPGSSHQAQVTIFAPGDAGKRIVLGRISDDRKGRHADLFLSIPHKPVRNNEIRIPGEDLVRKRMTWD